MKGMQLIPSPTEGDSRSISVEPTRTDIASTMQVSLAKRIIQPGTNKVVCLAAQTTVPMEDDDIASVSDLALRLSDGTNVKVSMSFFNDVALGADFAETTGRRFYDPDWYDNHRATDSSGRLWLVFAAFLAIAFGSFCYFIPGGIDRLAAEIAVRMPRVTTPPFMTNSPPSKSILAPSAQHILPAAPESFPSNRKTKRATRTAKVQSIKSSSHRSGKNHDGAIKVSRSSPNSRSMLIPPPPPTAFAIPISQMAMYNMPPYTMPNTPMEMPVKSASAKPKAKASSKTPNPMSLEIPKESTPNTSSQESVQSQSKPTLSREMHSLLPEPARAYSQPRRSATSFIDRVDKTNTASGAHSQSAPLPGGENFHSEQPQLERIDLLN